MLNKGIKKTYFPHDSGKHSMKIFFEYEELKYKTIIFMIIQNIEQVMVNWL